MMRTLFFFLLLGGAPLLWGQAQWHTDYKVALEKSRSEKKPLLLFFSGSDWSGWSMKMKREVLDSPSFLNSLGDQFVFVAIDFPANLVLPQEQVLQNEGLKKQYLVQEYPRLLLVDENERELARFGIESVEGLRQEILDVMTNKARLDRAIPHLRDFSSKELEEFYNIAADLKCSAEQQQILATGQSSEDPLFFWLEGYRHLMEIKKGKGAEIEKIREKILTLDPNNERGSHLTMALIDFQARESLGNLEPHSIIEPIERYLTRFGAKDTENGWRLEIMVAQFYLNYDRCHEALRHAEIASLLAPDARKNEVDHTLDYIRKQTLIANTDCYKGKAK